MSDGIVKAFTTVRGNYIGDGTVFTDRLGGVRHADGFYGSWSYTLAQTPGEWYFIPAQRWVAPSNGGQVDSLTGWKLRDYMFYDASYVLDGSVWYLEHGWGFYPYFRQFFFGNSWFTSVKKVGGDQELLISSVLHTKVQSGLETKVFEVSDSTYFYTGDDMTGLDGTVYEGSFTSMDATSLDSTTALVPYSWHKMLTLNSFVDKEGIVRMTSGFDGTITDRAGEALFTLSAHAYPGEF